MQRPCGPKQTSSNNAYSKYELIRIATEREIAPYERLRSMSMQELCESLEIPYSNPAEERKIAGIFFDDYDNCLKSKKDYIIEQNLELLNEKGITSEQAKAYRKDVLCDLIFKEKSPLVVPEFFDKQQFKKYNISSLKRIAVNLNIDYPPNITLQDLYNLIEIHYNRKDMIFNTDESKEWKEEADQEYKCLVPLSDKIKDIKEHQKIVVRHMLNHRSLLAFHSTGTGKTLTAVTAINCLLQKYPNIKVVVVTPATLVDNFKENFLRFGIDYETVDFASRVEIFSYDGFINIQKRKKQVDCKNTFLIIDEAHNFRSDPNIKETKLEKGSEAFIMMKCASQAFKVLLLSATPIVNSIGDLRNLIAMLQGTDPVDIIKRDRFIKELDSKPNEILGCKISYYEAPKEDFPDQIDVPIEETTLYMSDDYYTRYKAIEDKKASSDILQILNLKDSQRNFFYHNLRVATNALDGEQSPKVDWIIDFILKEAEAGRKSIVYTNWKSAGMNLLRKRLDLLNQPGLYGYISGNVSKKYRLFFKRKFNKNKIKILLITRAGGEGLDLKGTRNVIIMESNWNPSIEQQIIGRAVRYKSHEKLPEDQRNVHVYRLILKKPIGVNDKLASVDEILHNQTIEKEKKFKQMYEIIKNTYCIEKSPCVCIANRGNNLGGCQTVFIPEKYIDPNLVLFKDKEDESKERKTNTYEAPSGLSSLGIYLTEVGRRTFQALSGVTKQTMAELKQKEYVPRDSKLIDVQYVDEDNAEVEFILDEEDEKILKEYEAKSPEEKYEGQEMIDIEYLEEEIDRKEDPDDIKDEVHLDYIYDVNEIDDDFEDEKQPGDEEIHAILENLKVNDLDLGVEDYQDVELID